jgi:hypothetical protein
MLCLPPLFKDFQTLSKPRTPRFECRTLRIRRALGIHRALRIRDLLLCLPIAFPITLCLNPLTLLFTFLLPLIASLDFRVAFRFALCLAL